MNRWLASLSLSMLVGTLMGCAPAATETYTVNIDPADYVAEVNNSYYPLIPGSRYVYEGQTAGGLEHNEIEVLSETKEVMGIPTSVVRDTVYLNGMMIEDTLDWFAQDKDGNVWYFGEDVKNCQNGVLVNNEDEDALYEAMEQLYSRYDAYDNKAIAKNAQNRFSYSTVGKQIKEVYDKIIANGSETQVK